MSSLGFRENCTRIFGRKGTTFAFPPPPPRAVPGIRIAHEYRQIWSPSRNALALASSFVPWSQYAFVIRKVVHSPRWSAIDERDFWIHAISTAFVSRNPAVLLAILSLSLSRISRILFRIYIYIFVSASLSSWWPMYRLMRIVLSTSVSRLLGVTELNLDVDVSVLGDKAVLIRTVWIKRGREIIKLESNEIKWLCA